MKIISQNKERYDKYEESNFLNKEIHKLRESIDEIKSQKGKFYSREFVDKKRKELFSPKLEEVQETPSKKDDDEVLFEIEDQDQNDLRTE